ncbi:MAG TPA: hypothetical protein VJZ32_07575 [Candidatus Bathyarchaeia archaeon]|nr:hypothetical protein [Candidatus Bathyarchaeia archaeon]
MLVVSSNAKQLGILLRMDRAVKPMECIACNGSGEVPCWNCEGNAVFSIPCEDCHEAGTLGLDNVGEPIACENCGGHGNREGVCNLCKGLGVSDCERCGGAGNITDASGDEDHNDNKF